MNPRNLSILLLMTLFLLFGCTQEPEQPTATAAIIVEAAPTETATPIPATNTPAATVAAKPTVTPEPTPIMAALEVNTQAVTEEGTLVIDSVTSPEPGWVVLFADSGGIPGAVLGYEAVSPETEGSVQVTIDPRAATDTLHARLHLDAGNEREFEFPGSDIPLQVGSDEVMESFTVDIQLPVPAVEMGDQVVATDGLIQADNVFALGPSWLVIHTIESGVVAEIIGQIPVEDGQNTDLIIPIRWRDATNELMAVLYEDGERPGGFDPAADLPVLSGGSPVVARFNVKPPPDIFAYDQPIIDGKIVLERVISEQPGWVVVYGDNEGQPDLIIGFSKLEEGVNDLVEVEVVETAVTPQIFLALHEESADPLEFNFPASDLPATYDGQIIPPTILVTNPGNYLVTRDQALDENGEISVPLVVIDLNAWLVIYTENESGQPGEIIGQLWLPAGINRDNQVSVPATNIGDRLLAALHQDAGTPKQFDYPDGDDTLLQRNRQIILSPFLLEESSGVESFSP